MSAAAVDARADAGRPAPARVLVVGGASGIGLACVERAHRAGARVAVIDRDEAGLQRAAVDFAGLAITSADVTDADALGRAVRAAGDALGGLDALVYSAGIDLIRPLADLDLEAWNRSLAVNLTGPMLAARDALPYLRGGGAIVVVTSGAALLPVPGRSGYCAAKAGATMLAKALAMELAPDGIRVNAVCPGAVDTPLLRDNWAGQDDADAVRAAIAQRYALRRIASADEIAAAVLWLASPEASYVTGAALAVDGGRTFH